MQEQPGYSNPPSPQIQKSISRKPSFLKAPPPKSKHFGLELPRFYSSDQKKPKKNIFAVEKEEDIGPKINKNNKANISKKGSFKYSKTQKNETPTKLQGSIKTIKVNDQKWQQILKKGLIGGIDNSKNRGSRKKSMLQQVAGQKREECRKTPSNGNLNRIRYKISSHKREESQPKKESKEYEGVETEPLEIGKNQIKTGRDRKHLTEDKVKHSRPTINRVGGRNSELLSEGTKQSGETINGDRNVGKIRQVNRLQKQQIEYLCMVSQVLRKTIKNPSNLDFPEVYIVSQKSTFQKTIHNLMQQRFQKHFKMHVISTRFTFYLIAHLILIQMNTRILMAIFSKLIDSQLILAAILGVNQDKNGKKFHDQHIKKYSQSKMTLDGGRRAENDPSLSIQNRGNMIGKNNETIKTLLENILSKTKMPQVELFQSLLISSQKVDSFEFIAFLDKTLKWQILKMPSYPFLPPTVSHHQKFLILDLDQTLIHFDVDRQLFHVRPYAEQFIKNLSLYFQITIFTAGTKEYADEIIDQIDKQGYVKHRLYRNHLTFLQGQSVKDLTMLGREMKTTLIIDNLQSNFRINVENGIAIKSWFNDGEDVILQKLEGLLIKMAAEFGDDLRKGVRAYRNFINREIADKGTELKIKYKI